MVAKLVHSWARDLIATTGLISVVLCCVCTSLWVGSRVVGSMVLRLHLWLTVGIRCIFMRVVAIKRWVASSVLDCDILRRVSPIDLSLHGSALMTTHVAGPGSAVPRYCLLVGCCVWILIYIAESELITRECLFALGHLRMDSGCFLRSESLRCERRMAAGHWGYELIIA